MSVGVYNPEEASRPWRYFRNYSVAESTPSFACHRFGNYSRMATGCYQNHPSHRPIQAHHPYTGTGPILYPACPQAAPSTSPHYFRPISNESLQSPPPLQSRNSSTFVCAPPNCLVHMDESFCEMTCSQKIPILPQSEEDIDFSPIFPTPSPRVESSPAHVGPNLSYYPVDGAILIEVGGSLKE